MYKMCIRDSLEPESVDMPFGVSTGAGVIFGVTGGVTEAVIRRLSDDKSTDVYKRQECVRKLPQGTG